MSAFIIIVLALCFFMMLIYSITATCPINNNNDNAIENWVDYKEMPYGNIRTGAGSAMLNTTNTHNQIKFYEYPIYRRPLNWPVCHLVDYPQPHCRSDSL